MKYKIKSVHAFAAMLIAIGSLTGRSNAAVTFSQETGTHNLLVHFTQDLSFTVTASANYHYYELVLENAYSVNQAQNWGNRPTTTSTTILTLDNAGSIQSTGCLDGGILSYNALDANDLGLVFKFSSTQLISPGDSFLLSAGTYSFEKELPLPDAASFSAYIANGIDLVQVTDSVSVSSVPEPSLAFLSGLGFLCLMARRRRTS